MYLRNFIKHFTFRERDRVHITLGADTRLNAKTLRIQLQADEDGNFPTDVDLYVKTRLTHPQAVREWLGFEAVVVHSKVDSVQVTSTLFRLSDGTDEFYWTGSEWEVNTVDWNTEAEVAANIPDFPATSRKLQVVINLMTTNALATPEVIEIKVAYAALLDSEIEDMVLRSLVPSIRAGVRAITRHIITKATTSSTIDLDDYPLEGDYRVVDVDAVFNHTDDPNHNTDLHSSHTTRSTPTDPWRDGTVDVITLTGSVAADKVLWLRLLLEPVVAVDTSRDYYEVEHLPTLNIETIAFMVSSQRAGTEYVGDKNGGGAIVFPNPTQGQLEVTLAGISDKLVDSMRLGSAVSRYFGKNPLIASTGLDESYRLRLVDVHDSRSDSNEEDTQLWRKRFIVEDFCVWDRESRDGYLVKRFQTTGNLSVTVE